MISAMKIDSSVTLPASPHGVLPCIASVSLTFTFIMGSEPDKLLVRRSPQRRRHRKAALQRFGAGGGKRVKTVCSALHAR